MASSGNTSINRRYGYLLFALAALALKADFAAASVDVLPHLCDNVHCPPLEQIMCPDDSELRESIMPMAAALMQTLEPDSIAEEPPLPPPLLPSYNTSEIPDELYAHCCVAKKCMCRTCYIPECHDEHEVIYELTPELMEMPGKCCGTYKCRPEPKCQEVRDTESYWLTNCQRCKCFSGERICHQSCDEGLKKSTAICNSKKLNRFFEHGESWKVGCYECECMANGEEKCVMPFCRSIDCPPERQVMLKDSCCPICWPANVTMTQPQEGEYDEEDEGGEQELLPLPEDAGYDDDDDEESANALNSESYAEHELDLLPNVELNNEVANVTTAANATTTAAVEQTTSSTSATSTSSTSTSTARPTSPSTSSSTSSSTSTTTTTAAPTNPLLSNTTTSATTTSTPAAVIAPTTTAPCLLHNRQEAPATYQVYPEVVEVVRQTQQNDLLYAIIGFLALAVILLVGWNIHLRAKQRSYRPVSNFDDNFNKMSSNIKKMNDYV